MNNPLITPEAIREVRILGHPKGVHVGYFDNEEVLYAAIQPYDGKAQGIYFTLNPVQPELFERAPNRIIRSSKAATDKDIVRREQLLVDFDPVRQPGVSATDAEKETAFKKANSMKQWLAEQGWPAVVEADSGNGIHLLYRIDLPNDEPSHKIVRDVLKALASKFDDEAVKIDKGVHNAARITKLYGTLACKGPNTPDRPHRRSSILSIPPDIKVVPTDLLIALTKIKATEETKTGERVNLESLITRYKLVVVNQQPWKDDSQLYELAACPFNSDHTRASLIQFADGGVDFHCFHNSCADHDWAALRRKFAEMAVALLRKLPSSDDVKKTWLSFVDDLDVIGLQALITEVARLTEIGINTLKQAVAGHRAEAAKAATAERIGDRTVIPLYAGDICRAATAIEGVMVPRLTDGECVRCGDCVMYVTIDSLHQAHQADSELPAVPTAHFKMMTRAKLLPLMERVAMVRNEAGKFIDMPERVLDQILANSEAIPQVSGLITHPVVTRNGRIISAKGIDPDSRLLMHGPLIDGLRPYTQKEARRTIRKIARRFLEGFHFSTTLDRAIALAMLFTAVERKIMDSAPGFLPNAPQQGVGKTTLVRLLHIVLTGMDLPVYTWPEKEEEVQKLLFAALLSSPAIVCFDNVGDGMTFRSPTLAAAMTSATKKDRVLGFSRDASVSTSTLFVLTGNNVQLGNDESSRIMPTRLITKDVNPHKRTFKHPDVLRRGLDIRETVLRHIVGIIAGYRQSTDPIAASSRFVQWDALVRQPLIWAGVEDVGKVFDLNIEKSPELGAYRALVIHLNRIFLEEEFTAARLVKHLNEDAAYGEEPHPLAQALWALRVKDIRNVLSVSHALGRISDRTVEIDKEVWTLRRRMEHGTGWYWIKKGGSCD